MTETGGTMNCKLKGGSGEKGCSQTMPDTWVSHSKKILGYVAPQTEINDLYVSTLIIKSYLDKGYSEKDIFLTWNQGNKGHCVKGINKHGVAYNSCEYLNKALAYLQ